MQSRKQRKDFVHIGNIIGDVLKQFRSASDGELTRVWHIWDEVVGGTIAANAQPVAFKGDLLLVHVTSSAWIHELQFLKADIVSRLNAALGKPMVSEIKFKIGPFA
jgi:predicted nucleic acid-binding Zn ribbon protein